MVKTPERSEAVGQILPHRSRHASYHPDMYFLETVREAEKRALVGWFSP